MKNIRYTFYYPSTKIGGAQLLFSRIAEALITNSYEVLIIEKEDSFISTYLNEKQYNFEIGKITHTDKYILDKDDILILSLSYIHILKSIFALNDETRIVFWDLHPFALLESTAFSKIYKNYPNSIASLIFKKFEKPYITKVKRFVETATLKNSLYFMCLRNFITNRDFFDLSIDPIYLPIPIKLNEETYSPTKTPNPDIINIGWISRMDSEKVAILELLIKDIIHYKSTNSNIDIIIHIIGDGSSINILNKYKINLKENIRFLGVLHGNNLNNYLNNNIDIGFSMGTASLEFAARGIPTVLVPSMTNLYLFKDISNRYHWLQDIGGYDIAVENYHTNTTKIFDEIINDFLKKKTLSKLAYNYIHDNHSFDIVFDKFLKLSRKSNFTFKDIKDIQLYNGYVQKLLFSSKYMLKAIFSK